MFSKIIPTIKKYYFLPVAFMMPAKAFTGIHEEYVRNKHETFTRHTFFCFVGGYLGLLSGAFLGAVWPISFPIFIARCIDKSKKVKNKVSRRIL